MRSTGQTLLRYTMSAPPPPGSTRLNQVCELFLQELLRDFGCVLRATLRRRSREASTGAAAAFVAATRTADRPHGSGSCDAPQRAADRRSAGAEDWRQSQGRVRCTRGTMLHGDRKHLTRGSGPAVSLTRGRSGVTAACGAPRETACRPSPCPYWQASSLLRRCDIGRRRRRRRPRSR